MAYNVTIVFESSAIKPETSRFSTLIETMRYVEGYLEQLEDCGVIDRLFQIEISPSI